MRAVVARKILALTVDACVAYGVISECLGSRYIGVFKVEAFIVDWFNAGTIPMAEWYYSRNGQSSGPVNTATLKQLAAAGRLIRTDLLWREGMAAWMPASQAKGLFPGGTATTGPTPLASRDVVPIGPGRQVIAPRFMSPPPPAPEQPAIEEPTVEEPGIEGIEPEPPPFHFSRQTPKVRKPTMLHWAAIVPVVLFAIIECKWQLPIAQARTSGSDLAVAHFFGHAFAGLLWPLLIAWIVWKASRSQLAATLTYCLLVLAVSATSYRTAMRDRPGVAQQSVAAVLADLAQKDQASKRASDVSNEAGGISAAGAAASVELLDRRISALDASIAARQALLEAGDGAPTVLRRRLESQGSSAGEIEEAVQSLNQQANWVVARKRVATSFEHCRAGRALLAFLRDHHGHWTDDSPEQGVVLDSDAGNKQYQALLQPYLAALRAAKAAQAE